MQMGQGLDSEGCGGWGFLLGESLANKVGSSGFSACSIFLVCSAFTQGGSTGGRAGPWLVIQRNKQHNTTLAMTQTALCQRGEKLQKGASNGI